MTLEDPFYVVKDEVFRALNKTRGLYVRWAETGAGSSGASDVELRNALRSIDWDLEDLEDTICIVEKNSTKFKIDNKEINDRRSFIETTKQEVQAMRCKVAARGRRVGSAGYARLASADGDSPARRSEPFVERQLSKQTSLHLDDHAIEPCELQTASALPCDLHVSSSSCSLHQGSARCPRILRDYRQWVAIGLLTGLLMLLVLLFMVL